MTLAQLREWFGRRCVIAGLAAVENGVLRENGWYAFVVQAPADAACPDDLPCFGAHMAIREDELRHEALEAIADHRWHAMMHSLWLHALSDQHKAYWAKKVA